MANRLPEKYRVRSLLITDYAAVATGVASVTSQSHVFQDDVTIIGVEINMEWLILDAMSNADGLYNGLAEVSRQGTRSQPGYLIGIETQKVWNAAIVIGSGDNRKTERMFYPAGYGVEIDEGESVTLMSFLECVTNAGPFSCYLKATIYYVER